MLQVLYAKDMPIQGRRSRSWFGISFAHLSVDLGCIRRIELYREQQSVSSNGRGSSAGADCFDSNCRRFHSAADNTNVAVGIVVSHDMRVGGNTSLRVVLATLPFR